MQHILIVEDDTHTAKMMEAALSIGKYNSSHCDDGNQAVETIQQQEFDLVLLDVMLPGLNGFEVMEKIRDKGILVIFLSAPRDMADKGKGLRLWAEDYIVKPFEAVELLARVEAALRRCNKGSNQLAFGDILVDIEQHTVKKQGKPVTLTPKEFGVLVCFLQNVDILLTKERLLSTVWGFEFMGESRTVEIHVQQVRRKLGLHGCLLTVPKLGYRLEAGEEDA